MYKIVYPYCDYIYIYKTIYGCKECFHSKIECLHFLQDEELIKSKIKILLEKFKEKNHCIINCKYTFMYTALCEHYKCEEFQKFIKENQLEEYIDEQINLDN